MEIWKDVNGYTGLYQISNLGNVKRNNKILKPYFNSKGYYRVDLYKDGIEKKYTVHRLVAEHFIPNPDNKPCIDHINTNKTDNRVENLRWVTHKENNNNPKSKYKQSIPVLQFSLDGELVNRWESIRDIEREIGIRNSAISHCLKSNKICGGFKWRKWYKKIWEKSHIPLKNVA